MRTSKDLVSVIIPAFNEEKVIEKNLRSIKYQSYKNLEIIVVDDASEDKTSDIAKRYTDNVYRREHAERSVQRNFGVQISSGKYILIPDADMELSENVVEECVELANRDAKIGAIIIPELSVANSFWEKVKAFERSFYNETEKGDEATDAARFFSRKAFNDAGGYDETITGPEDWDLPDKIKEKGYKVGRIKSKILHHERVPNPFMVAKKKYYYGLKAYRYIEKHKIPLVGAKTIYILRPVFYKNWKKLLGHPIISLAMFFMLTLEQFGGGLGYLIGKTKKL